MTSSRGAGSGAQKTSHAFEQTPRLLLRIEPRWRGQVRPLLDQVGHQSGDFGQPDVRQLHAGAEARHGRAQQVDERVIRQAVLGCVARADEHRPARAGPQLARGSPSVNHSSSSTRRDLPMPSSPSTATRSTAPGAGLLGSREQLRQRRLPADQRKAGRRAAGRRRGRQSGGMARRGAGARLDPAPHADASRISLIQPLRGRVRLDAELGLRASGLRRDSGSAPRHGRPPLVQPHRPGGGTVPAADRWPARGGRGPARRTSPLGRVGFGGALEDVEHALLPGRPLNSSHSSHSVTVTQVESFEEWPAPQFDWRGRGLRARRADASTLKCGHVSPDRRGGSGPPDE